MRFSCEKAVLNDAISVCIHAVSPKSSIPALEGLLITAGTDVSLCGHNFKTAIQKNFDADVTESKLSYRLNYSVTSFANCPMISLKSQLTTA